MRIREPGLDWYRIVCSKKRENYYGIIHNEISSLIMSTVKPPIILCTFEYFQFTRLVSFGLFSTQSGGLVHLGSLCMLLESCPR